MRPATPAVSLRPGNTITRLVPSEVNWFITYSRAPSPRPVRTMTAPTPIAMAIAIKNVRLG